MEEEKRKGKRNKNVLENFLLVMAILFIGISCFISYKMGCIVTERKYIQENIAEIQKLTEQQELTTGGREYE